MKPRGPPNEKTTLVYVGNLDQQGVGRGGRVGGGLTSKPNWSIRIFMNQHDQVHCLHVLEW